MSRRSEDRLARSSARDPRPSEASHSSVLQRFRVVARATQRHSQWVERKSSVSGAQLWAMQELADQPGQRIGELAERLAIHQSTASNMLDRIERRGLVRRDRTGSDQRVVRVFLTPQGEEVLARSPGPARGLLPEALRRMSPEAIANLQVALDELLEHMGEIDAGFEHHALAHRD
jgi:DNA-binding MarR family transcriptional regulator